MAKKPNKGPRYVAQNRRARHDYFIEETIEAGLVLAGTEVKSLREGRASINDAHAGEMKGEMWLFNAYIPEYNKAVQQFAPDTRRPRKLLLHQKEIKKLLGQVKQKGYTLIPLDIHFKRGYAKVTLGLAKGKKQYDKRETIKERDWQREQRRALKDKG